MKQVVATLAVLIVLGVAGTLAFVYSGFYDVAATQQHTAPVYWLITTTSDRSIAVRADTPVPEDMDTPDAARAGLPLYRDHCLQCHGAPGEPPQAMALGMTPVPPNLLQAAREWPANHVFWIIKHGVKMSGMPAWTVQMSDAEIWAVTAFVRAMAHMTPGDYARMAEQAGAPARPSPEPEPEPPQRADGDRERGKRALTLYGCTACHTIEGMVGPDIRIGPPLRTMKAQKRIAGVLENTTPNLVRWITDPQGVDPRTAMPDVGVPPADALDMAAYLYDPD